MLHESFFSLVWALLFQSFVTNVKWVYMVSVDTDLFEMGTH